MATKITLDGYDSYSGADIVVVAQLSNINNENKLSKKCYILGSLQTISISTYQDKAPVRSIGNINAIDYLMGPRSIAGSLVFAVFDRHFAYDIFNDLKEYTGKTTLLTDEIPPLDMTINFQNEYGKRSKMILYGVKMVTEGQVMSINDLFTENTYQFVATGLENLTPEEGSYSKFTPNSKSNPMIINPTNIPFDTYDNYPTGNKFDYNKESTSFIPSSSNEKPEISYVRVNQPLIDEDYGTITVGLNDPDAIELVVTNKYKNDDEFIYTSHMFDNKNEWDINVPQGIYNIACIDKKTEDILDEITNIIIKLDEKSSNLNDYPIINDVSDTSINVETNNPNHNNLTILQENNKIETVKVMNNNYVFKNLVPNTKYKFYSSNEESTSKIATCTTLCEKNELAIKFKEFVFNNKNLWINDLSLFDYNILKNENELNLINKIANSDFQYKYELLLYAIKYQNSFIRCANSENNINIIYNNDLLNPLFEISNEYDRLNYYYTNSNNYYYITSKKINDSSLVFNINNKPYYVYAIDSNKLKSLKYDCYSFDENTKNYLNKYKNIFIDYNDYDLNNYKNNYNNTDIELLETIVLKDNNIPIIPILDAPSIIYNRDDEILYIDLDYQELLNKDEDYYLCICNKNDTFQYTPIIKIKIQYNTISMYLSKYESHLKKDNYYLIYIEDKDNNIISYSSILSTYSNTIELDNYNLDNIKNILKPIKSFLLQKYSCKDLIESIYLSVLSYNNLSTKNFLNIFIQELLNTVIDSLQCNNLDSMFVDVIQKEFFNIINIPLFNVLYDNGSICFSNNKYNIVVLDFYVGDEYPQKSIFLSNEYIDISNRDSYYTLIYGINKKTRTKTGFFLKNNVTKKEYYYKLVFEEVK